MTPEEVETLLRSTRPAAVSLPPPVLGRNSYARLQPLVAAALLVGAIALALGLGRTTRDEPATPSEPRWLLPVEISRDPADRWSAVTGRQHVVRTDGGGAAFVWDWGILVSKDGKAPWTRLDFDDWHPSRPVVHGEEVSFLTTKAYVTVDVSKAAIVRRVKLPTTPSGAVAYKRWNVHLAARGRDRYAVVEGLGGKVAFSRSEDGGDTWSPFQAVTPERVKPDTSINENSSLLLAGNDLLLFYLTDDHRAACRRSGDGGATWSDGESPAFGELRIVRGATTGTTSHLVCVTADGRLLRSSSADLGRSWSPPEPVRSGLSAQMGLQLTSGAEMLLLTWKDEALCHLLRSADGGGTWTEGRAYEGIRGEIKFAPAFAGPDGAITTVGVISQDKAGVAFFREFRTPPPSAPLNEEGRRRVDELIRQLESDDIQARDAAARALVEMGASAAGAVEEASKRARDPEVRGRLRDVLDRAHLTWPDPKNVPAWWVGPPK